jgi:hypothetical protein
MNPVLHFSSDTFACPAQEAKISSKSKPKLQRQKKQERHVYEAHLIVAYKGEYIVSRDGKRCFTAGTLAEARSAVQRLGGCE